MRQLHSSDMALEEENDLPHGPRAHCRRPAEKAKGEGQGRKRQWNLPEVQRIFKGFPRVF